MKAPRRALAGVVGPLALALLPACLGGGAPPRATEAELAHVDEVVLAERVENALRRASPVAFADVAVEVHGDVATLSGPVRRPEDAAWALRLAADVHGVSAVRDELETGSKD